MKHSDFSEILYSIRQTEISECRAALLKHCCRYHFGECDSLGSTDELPHVYLYDGSEILVEDAEIVDFDTPKERILVFGKNFKDYLVDDYTKYEEYELERGSFHELMDYMDEPSEIY